MPIQNDIKCSECGCTFLEHGKFFCATCALCPKFASRSGASRFTSFLKWSRSYIKKYDKSKFHLMWNLIKELKLNQIVYLDHCPICINATIVNVSLNLGKKISIDDGLACSNCGSCGTCCGCSQCNDCAMIVGIDYSCGSCNLCHGCCECYFCSNCADECSNNGCRDCDTCNDCCECDRKIKFFSQPPKFHVANRLQRKYNLSTRVVAAEIEVANIENEDKNTHEALIKIVKDWGGSIVRDGSLASTGFEINTAPASGDLFVNQINEICESLKVAGASVDKLCGLHIHVDARDFTFYDIRRLVKVYSLIEPALFSMVPPSRSKSRFCLPCGEAYSKAINFGRLPYKKVKTDVINGIYQQPSTQFFKKVKYHNSRYNALNLHSWFYRGSVECRMFNGTINADKIINWGVMWELIMDYALITPDDTIDQIQTTPYETLQSIVSSNIRVKEFVKQRYNKFLIKPLNKD